MQDYFADNIGTMTVIGGTVRIEFVRISSIDPATKQPVYEPSHRLVMPLQGFMQSAERHGALQRKLQEAGLVPNAPTTAPTLANANPAAPDAAAAAEKKPKKNQSLK